MIYINTLERVPEHINKLLSEEGILIRDIVSFAFFDISVIGSYFDTYIIATTKELHIISGEVKEQERIARTEKLMCWNLHSYEKHNITEIKSLFLINMISTCMLVMRKNDNEIALCACTKKIEGKAELFVKQFAKFKEDNELLLDDTGKEKFNHSLKNEKDHAESKHKYCIKDTKTKNVLWRLMESSQKYRWTIACIIMFMILNVVISLIIPYLEGTVLFDKALNKTSELYGKVGFVVLLIMLCYIISTIFNIFYEMINAKFAAHVIYDLKNEIFNAIQRMSLSFFENIHTGRLMTNVNSDSGEVHYFFVILLPNFVVNIMKIICISILLFILNWKLAIITLIPLPLIFILIYKTYPKLGRLNGWTHNCISKINSIISDSLSGIRVVKVFGKESLEIKRFERANAHLNNVESNSQQSIKTILSLITLLIQMGSIIIWVAGGWQVMNNIITFGIFMTFINSLSILYEPIEYLAQNIQRWSFYMNAAQRMYNVIDGVPEVTEGKNPIQMDDIKGEITIQDVSFSYEPNKPVLKNINLTIKPNQMIGIVGRSGAGKSTLVNLISRLYDVKDGSIYIDGVNIKDISKKDIQRSIGIVSQEAYIFMGSVSENIAYANPDCSFNDIIRAAKTANIHNLIMSFSDGYDTVIGSGGRSLSGGEKQRIAIARAILHNPRVLIFDEATASLDTKTEKQVQKAIEALITGRTTIAIAHRLSTLRYADKLVVIEDGMVVETGTHMELVKNKGLYFEMMRKQTESIKFKGVG